MTTFLKKNPEQGKWLEWEIQAYVVQEARRLGYFIEGDQNANKRGYGAANRAKACGMTAGTPDLRVLLRDGKVLFFELKRLNGKMSDSQIEWHNRAMDLGHRVYRVWADCPYDAWVQIKYILGTHRK
jgi:hypothetical protein